MSAATESETRRGPAVAIGRTRRIAMAAMRRSWLVAAILAVWWIVTSAGWVAPFQLPSPESVWSAIHRGFTEGVWAEATWSTFLRLIQGWAIGAGAAIVLGVMTAGVQWLEDGIRPVLMGLQSVPTIAFLPLAAIWLGFNQTAVLAVTAFGTFKPMALATYGALHQVPPNLRLAGKAMGARGLFYQRTLLLPAAFPSLVVGLKLSWSFAWRSLMAAELIVAGTPGLGGVLELGRELQAIDIVIAVIVIIAAIGVLFEQLVFARVERYVQRRWGLSTAR